HDFILKEFFKKRADEWAPKQTGWDINYDDFQVMSDPFTKFLTGVAANQGVPELMLIQIEQMSKFLKKDIAATALTDLSPLIKDAGGPENFIKLGVYSLKGKPYCVDTVAGAVVYFYREDLLQEAGVKLPILTFDDLVGEGQKLAAKGQYIDDAGLSGKFNRYLEMRNGSGVFDKEGKVLMDSPEAFEVLQLRSDMLHKHKVTSVPDTETGQTAAYQANKVAGIIYADWWPPFTMATKYKSTLGKWRAQMAPQIVKGVDRSTSLGGVGASIYQNALNKDLVTDFYKY